MKGGLVELRSCPENTQVIVALEITQHALCALDLKWVVASRNLAFLETHRREEKPESPDSEIGSVQMQNSRTPLSSLRRSRGKTCSETIREGHKIDSSSRIGGGGGFTKLLGA